MVSRYVLEKQSRTAILRGMMHVAQPHFFESVREEMDRAIDDGYAIFVEGVHRDPTVPVTTGNAKRILNYLRFLFAGYSYLAKKRGLEKQVVRPKASPRIKTADISQQDLANLADAAGVKISPSLHLFISAAVLATRKPGRMADFSLTAVEKCGGKWFERSLKNLQGAMSSLLLDHRNAIIFRKVMEQGGDENLLLAYGNRHLDGLLRLFLKDGWSVRDVTEHEC